MKAFLNHLKTWNLGDEIILVSETGAKTGETVDLYSRIGNHFGTKVIATGKVTSVCAEEAKAPIAPTSNGQSDNAWRNYFRVKIDKFLP